MNPSSRRILLLGALLTVALVVIATVSDDASVGPVVFWAVHHSVDTQGSTVALRPGMGLLALWFPVVVAAVLMSRRHDV